MYHRILLAIDPRNDNESKRTLEQGLSLIKEGGELFLATVFSPGGAGFFPHVSEQTPEEQQQITQQELQRLAKQYLPEQQAVQLRVMIGSPGEQLVALAASIEADLMIMVSRGAATLWTLRKATIESILINAPCPVLVLPADKTCALVT